MRRRKMKSKKLLLSLGYLGAVGFGIFFLFFVITGSWIGYEVKQNCKEAQVEYGRELSCTTALTRLLEDERQSYARRNSAIWALGQEGDPASLEVLRKYYTGEIPEREPLNQTISQYELKKAIVLAEGGVNLTAIFWRR